MIYRLTNPLDGAPIKDYYLETDISLVPGETKDFPEHIAHSLILRYEFLSVEKLEPVPTPEPEPEPKPKKIALKKRKK